MMYYILRKDNLSSTICAYNDDEIEGSKISGSAHRYALQKALDENRIMRPGEYVVCHPNAINQLNALEYKVKEVCTPRLEINEL